MARILLADDELDLLEVFAELLRDAGHDVRTAADGLEALRAIRRWRPDVAVLDVDMPNMSGPSIAAELSRERGGLEDIPVVLLSGNANIDRVAKRTGIPYRITKPVGAAQFMKTLDSALAHRPA